MKRCIICLLPWVLLSIACSTQVSGRNSRDEGQDGEPRNTAGNILSMGGREAQLSTGSGGQTTGGSDSGSGGDTGESGRMPRPSLGCSKSSTRPENGIVYEQKSSPAGPGWLIFPEKYDGSTPFPVLVGFHGCGGGGDEKSTPFLGITRNSPFEGEYVVVAPVADPGNCYDYATDMPSAKALFTELVDNYCVDLDRVYGTGHSYGAGGMLMTLTDSSRIADFAHFNFRAIVPVAGWAVWEPQAVVPTMYIQGVTDAERGGGNGKDAVDKIVDVNQCGLQTAPYAVDACKSGHDGDAVDAGCVSYQGCEVETIWCSHNDSSYGGTFHGIPCFYQQAMYDFFEGLSRSLD